MRERESNKLTFSSVQHFYYSINFFLPHILDSSSPNVQVGMTVQSLSHPYPYAKYCWWKVKSLLERQLIICRNVLKIEFGANFPSESPCWVNLTVHHSRTYTKENNSWHGFPPKKTFISSCSLTKALQSLPPWNLQPSDSCSFHSVSLFLLTWVVHRYK